MLVGRAAIMAAGSSSERQRLVRGRHSILVAKRMTPTRRVAERMTPTQPAGHATGRRPNVDYPSGSSNQAMLDYVWRSWGPPRSLLIDAPEVGHEVVALPNRFKGPVTSGSASRGRPPRATNRYQAGWGWDLAMVTVSVPPTALSAAHGTKRTIMSRRHPANRRSALPKGRMITSSVRPPCTFTARTAR